MKLVAAFLIFLSGAPLIQANEQKAVVSHTQAMMREKLETYQKMMAALVANQFSDLNTLAIRMQDISKSASWHQADQKDFMEINKFFTGIAERMAHRAREKNIEGAAMEYVHMTLTCIQCHKKVRDK